MAKAIIRSRGVPPQSKTNRRPQAAFIDILGGFSDAMAMVEVAVRSLDAEGGRGGAELLVLARGLQLMKLAYNQFDVAVSRLDRG